jgi:SAM-dependent methyltransferase
MSPTILPDQLPVEHADVVAGRLPARYGFRLQDVFMEHLTPLLRDDIAILDIGAGRAPTLPPDGRPAGCRYVGLDISAEELAAAPAGAYDEVIAADITAPFELSAPVDLAISWQVLEHVKPIDRAFENLHAALRPGGTLLAVLSGGRAAFAVLARVMPHAVRSQIMVRLLGHAADEKFPTAYDRCTASALEGLLARWGAVQVVPFYRGATYFNMSRTLQRAYLVYENELERRDARDLATHYLVVATRAAA